jgi:hypothetical protein
MEDLDRRLARVPDVVRKLYYVEHSVNQSGRYEASY